MNNILKKIRQRFNGYGVIVGVVIVMIVGTLLNGESFLTINNVSNVGRQATIRGLLACGMALGLAQFLMVLMNQDKLNPVLYMYYVQLGLLLVIITLSVAFLTDGYRNILYRGYLKEFIAVIHQMTIIFATEVICLFSFRLIGLFSRLVLFATFFVGILFMYAERLLTKNYLRRKFRNIKYARTIMVIATEQQAGILIRQLSSRVLTIFKIQ